MGASVYCHCWIALPAELAASQLMTFGGAAANFIDAMRKREQPVSDVWSHNRMLEICHLSNIAMRLDREVKWNPIKREIIGDEQANSFLSRENRKGYEINM